MNKDWLDILKNMLNAEFSYDSTYTYDDMKLAIVCGDLTEEHIDFEDVITLAEWVKMYWEYEYSNLSIEEQAYIQAYGQRIIRENVKEITDILRSKYE